MFRGNGIVDDFPGNYTQYRDYQAIKEKEAIHEEKKARPSESKRKPVHEGSDRRRRLTYAERKEYEALEKDIENLETEKAEIETKLCSGTLSVEEITALSCRLPEVNNEIDEKSMRWLELSEWA